MAEEDLDPPPVRPVSAPSRRGGRHAARQTEPDDGLDVTALDVDGPDEPGRHGRRGLARRHPVLVSAIAVVLLLAGAVAGFGLYLNAQLSNIDTYQSRLDSSDRVPRFVPPAGSSPAAAEPAMNFLLLGLDNGNSGGPTIAEQLSSGKVDVGSHRSDTIMVLHVPADRSAAYVVSIPRDSFVTVPGYGTTKINAAFSYGGPDLAVRAVETLTQVHIDHVVMIDWNGFKVLTTALGGIEVTIPVTITDKNGKVVWAKGPQVLQGDRALAYVRERYNLPGGDFDRIKRQQNFLRAVLKKTFDQLSLTNIGQLTDVLKIFTGSTTVDAELTPSVIRGLAWSLRGVGSGNVVFMTVPVTGVSDVAGASVVLLDEAKMQPLCKALREDTMPAYLTANTTDQLPADGQVK